MNGQKPATASQPLAGGILRHAARLRGAWQALVPRERMQLTLGLAALALALLWLLGVRPALASLSYWEAELPKLRSQAQALETVLNGAGAAAAPTEKGLALADRLGAALDHAGFAGSYRFIDGAQADGVQFELSTGLPAARLMPWLLDAPTALGLEIAGLALRGGEAGGGQGVVLGTVSLRPARTTKEEG
ncbi:type II secretion system protein M [Azoarcus sp. TTM-91]|uniref:type II secretion system protein GspM n=1 Tax=Azoarcus sp. TTM-91 TaxID=2691581 RepID=UPI00145DCFC8|nr:type II secretion system protein GspM [Azoarcus sp. TTM-91]NMG35321.1 type II secretion system protein M [Azoarcus sp. TTM-91]